MTVETSFRDLAPRPTLFAEPRRPIFTFILIGLLVIVFEVELLCKLGSLEPGLSPTTLTLAALGGVQRAGVLSRGEWWRLATGPLLHGSLEHIALNCVALFFVGRRLEPMIGGAWLVAIFCFSAIGGSLMSLALNPVNIVGVGASGGIVGLFAAAVLLAMRMPHNRARSSLTAQALFGLLSSVVPFFLGGGSTHDGMTVDYAGHLGGAIAGFAIGEFVFTAWRGDWLVPAYQRAAVGIVAVYAAAAILAAVPMTLVFHEYRQLVPALPVDPAQFREQADDLANRYPHDPRPMFEQGAKLLSAFRLPQAEERFRTGLAEHDLLRDTLDPSVEINMRAALAMTLYAQGKKDDAQASATPVCGAAEVVIERLLEQSKLCPETAAAKAAPPPARAKAAGGGVPS